LSALNDSETLFPLGAGVFVKGKLASVDKVVMNVGKGVAVEKDVSGAQKLVDEQIKSLEGVFTQMNAEMTDIVSQLQVAQMEMVGQQE
tara:strand:+ start:1713 stop:1976 length:264 start_codon:yes stop_codon:yes gene_type:complete